jgi:hypothetical protein
MLGRLTVGGHLLLLGRLLDQLSLGLGIEFLTARPIGFHGFNPRPGPSAQQMARHA